VNRCLLDSSKTGKLNGIPSEVFNKSSNNDNCVQLRSIDLEDEDRKALLEQIESSAKDRLYLLLILC